MWTELPLKGYIETPGGLATVTVQNSKGWQVVSRFSFPLGIPYETHINKIFGCSFHLAKISRIFGGYFDLLRCFDSKCILIRL